MPHQSITEQDLAALIERVSTAAQAYISGDMDTYFSLIHHADDFTLMSPFGGEPERGFDTSPAHIADLKRYFRGGAAEVEVAQTYVSGDLAVLVVIERQRGEVGGLPEQDWSLRVTWVFRRTASDWEQVHRHADALVHPISMDQLSALARG